MARGSRSAERPRLSREDQKMRHAILLLLAILSLCAGCTTVNVTADNGSRVDIRTDRIVNTLPVNAEGNTVPMSALP